MANIKRGTVARCGLGALGLITNDEPQPVTYPDGSKGIAWVGVQLTDKLSAVGQPWCSRKPTPVSEPEAIDAILTALGAAR